MRLHDGAANAKSHTGAVGFGSKESIEDLVRLLRGKPYTGVTDRDQKLLVFRSLRPDGELPRPILVLHRFDAIDHQVHQHLLHLHAVGHDLTPPPPPPPRPPPPASRTPAPPTNR